MIKEIEELYKERAYAYDDKIHSKDKGWNEAIQHYDNIGKLLNDIELKLQRLDSIDNANPSEALECVEDLIFNFSVDEYVDRYDNNLQVIKQALLKSQEQEKENELLKERIQFLEKEYNNLMEDKDNLESELFKQSEPKQYLKWEDLEFKENNQRIKVKLGSNIYTLDFYIGQFGKTFVLNLQHYCEAKDNIQFFNDLRLERVEE